MNRRFEIVKLYEQDGLKEREIARQLEIAPSTVHYWLTRRGRAADTKTGRRRATETETDDQLYAASVENPFKTAVDLKREFQLSCHVDTIRNRLKEKGLKSYIPARKPFLNQEHRQKRNAFAFSHLHWSTEAWHRVVFTDEKVFRSSSRGALRVYRPKNNSDRFDEQYLAPSTNPADTGTARFTICVWMAFGGDGIVRQLHRIREKTLRAGYYIENVLPLIQNPITENNLIFMQDLSSIHTSQLSRTWLNNKNLNVLWDWPPKGPDMNPVENVWAVLVHRIEKRTRGVGIENKDRLWEHIQHAFDSLEDSYFKNLIASMHGRVDTVSVRNGGWTKY